LDALLTTLLGAGNVLAVFSILVNVYQWKQMADRDKRYDELLDKFLTRDDIKTSVLEKYFGAIVEIRGLIQGLIDRGGRR